MKKSKLMLMFVFVVLVFGFSIGSLITPVRSYSVQENRTLTAHPKLSVKSILSGKYQKQYENFLSDQFFGRDAWVSLATRIQATFHQKDINGVYIGKDGYLLEKDEAGDVDHLQVKDNEKYVTKFINAASKKFGKKHVSFMMVPSKTSIMKNKLPDYASYNDHSDVIKALRHDLNDPNQLLDLSKALNQKNNQYIYYRTDHHWTTLGAYYAYDTFAKQTKMATPHAASYYHQVKAYEDFYGTTYNKIHLKVPADTVTLYRQKGDTKVKVAFNQGKNYHTMYFDDAAKKGFNRYDVFFSKNTFQVDIRTHAHTGKTLLMAKDSFANSFVPFLIHDYDHIIMIDYRYGVKPMNEILAENKDITDVLVMFNTEKFMKNTKLKPISEMKKSKTRQEFNASEFLS